MDTKNDNFWMNTAIVNAKEGNTPYGAIVVNENGEYISAFNTTKKDGATAHAEINVLRKLNYLDFDHPQNLTLYSTVEPCPMCMSAIVWAGIGHVVFGATIEDASKYGNQINISAQEVVDKAWYSVTIKSSVEREKCLELLEKK